MTCTPANHGFINDKPPHEWLNYTRTFCHHQVAMTKQFQLTVILASGSQARVHRPTDAHRLKSNFAEEGTYLVRSGTDCTSPVQYCYRRNVPVRYKVPYVRTVQVR
jgi:hypothetical protein